MCIWHVSGPVSGRCVRAHVSRRGVSSALATDTRVPMHVFSDPTPAGPAPGAGDGATVDARLVLGRSPRAATPRPETPRPGTPRLVPGPPWFVADGATCTDVWPYVPTEPRPLPFADGARIPAGFPSPADDFDEAELDIAEHLVRNPDATFFVRAQGESMVRRGIHSGDVLVVDKSVEPRVGMVVIAVLDDQMTVKELGRVGRQYALLSHAADPAAYPPILVGPEQELRVWGVVVGVARSMLP